MKWTDLSKLALSRIRKSISTSILGTEVTDEADLLAAMVKKFSETLMDEKQSRELER